MHGVIGAQMRDTLFAVDKNGVAVQRLAGDPFGVYHQRDRPRTRHDGRVAANRAVFKHDALERLAVFEQFTGSNVARHEDRIFGHVGRT